MNNSKIISDLSEDSQKLAEKPNQRWKMVTTFFSSENITRTVFKLDEDKLATRISSPIK